MVEKLKKTTKLFESRKSTKLFESKKSTKLFESKKTTNVFEWPQHCPFAEQKHNIVARAAPEGTRYPAL